MIDIPITHDAKYILRGLITQGRGRVWFSTIVNVSAYAASFCIADIFFYPRRVFGEVLVGNQNAVAMSQFLQQRRQISSGPFFDDQSVWCAKKQVVFKIHAYSR